MGGKGLVIVYTGGGKGKTSAALGLVLRAVGYNHKVCMIQFVKGSWHYGELDSAKRLEPEFELVTAGKGFVGIIDDKSPREDHVKAANDALAISKEKILSGKYDVVILDEINYAIQLELVTLNDVLEVIKSKPNELDLVLTGNLCPVGNVDVQSTAAKKIIEVADLVTEMKEIKHPFKSGIKSKKRNRFLISNNKLAGEKIRMNVN